MFKPDWIHPNKQNIQTGHKTFDRKCVAITPGQVLSSGQVSFCVRSASRTECNGHTFPPRYLQDIDLKSWNLPAAFEREVRRLANENEIVLLYKFRHLTGPQWNNKEIIHGYVVTTLYGAGYKLLQKYYIRTTRKSRQVVDWATNCIAD